LLPPIPCKKIFLCLPLPGRAEKLLSPFRERQKVFCLVLNAQINPIKC
jgi:hypothetical protein